MQEVRRGNRSSGSRGKQRRRRRGGCALLAVDGLLKRFRRPAWSKPATLDHAHAPPHVLRCILWRATLEALVAPPLLACCSDLEDSPWSRLGIGQGEHSCQTSSLASMSKIASAEKHLNSSRTMGREHEGGPPTIFLAKILINW